MISLDWLAQEGLLSESELADLAAAPGESGQVDYPWAEKAKRKAFHAAAHRFFQGHSPPLEDEYQAFLSQAQAWLEDYALFVTLKRSYEGRSWTEWDAPFKRRSAAALDRLLRTRGPEIEEIKFLQFIFFRQWREIRAYAAESGIMILGDLPFFVSLESADVWVRPDLFCLDPDGQPVVVAGVPPDYFSPTGQRWGMPHYRWGAHQAEGYCWWLDRFRMAVELFDVVRLDHFRGFAATWQIPAECPTAEEGAWVPTPGDELLSRARHAVGGLPAFAEDLGVITPDVIELRDRFHLPGMRVLQFELEALPEVDGLPHLYSPACIAYTGTHDNDTSFGWFVSRPKRLQDQCLAYLGTSADNVSLSMVRAVWNSPANWAIAPMQDFLQLGSDARMNRPGTTAGNWAWRLAENQLGAGLGSVILEMNKLSGRCVAHTEIRKRGIDRD